MPSCQGRQSWLNYASLGLAWQPCGIGLAGWACWSDFGLGKPKCQGEISCFGRQGVVDSEAVVKSICWATQRLLGNYCLRLCCAVTSKQMVKPRGVLAQKQGARGTHGYRYAPEEVSWQPSGGKEGKRETGSMASVVAYCLDQALYPRQ